MLQQYHTLFKIFLGIPIIGIINSMIFNKFYKLQKSINNLAYILLLSIITYILILFTEYGDYEFKLFNISNNIPIVFTLNSFNLSFAVVVSYSIFFINLIFQNYFNFLEIPDKYVLYNKPMSFLYFFYILFPFINNIILVLFLYLFILFYSMLLIANPDLKGLREKYTKIFVVGAISVILLFLLSAIYFAIQDIKDFDIYYIIGIIIIYLCLICVNYTYPIYIIFKESFYYEDLLPISIILLFPFMFLNTFLFIKLLRFLFVNNLVNLSIYFYYAGILPIILYLIAIGFGFKYIKNSIKFILIFIFANYFIFLSQLFFSNTEYELLRNYTNFLLLYISDILIILSYCAILFILLATNIININLVYKRYKLEVNFYIFCILILLLFNFSSFFSLNLYNFNLFYFINLIEIVLSVLYYIIYLFFFLKKKKDSKLHTGSIKISEGKRIRFIIAQIIFLIFVVMLLVYQESIIQFLMHYK